MAGRTPDAAGDEARPPVPPVVVGRLAGEHREHLGRLIVRRRQRVAEPIVGRLGHRDRRAKVHDHRVGAGDDPRLDVGAPGAKHVVRRQHPRPVDRHLREGVEALEDDLDPVTPQQRGVGDERRPVLPVGALDPLQRLFVGAVKRVGDLPGPQEIRVDAPRHLGRDRGPEPGRSVHRPQRPGTERDRLTEIHLREGLLASPGRGLG